MPLAAIGLGLGTAIAGGATAGATLYGAHKQASAANKAAQLQSDAAERAAQVQLESDREQRAFLEAQAKRDEAAAEATRRGNYDLNAARERRLGSLGALIGAAPREIPPYVPLYGDGPMPGGGAMSATGSGSAPTLGATFDPAAAEAAYRGAYTNGQPFDTQYWQGKWGELVARGNEIKYVSPVDGQAGGGAYARDRLIGYQATGRDAPQAGFFAGARTAAPAAMSRPIAAGSLGMMTNYTPTQILTPALSAAPAYRRSYSLADLTGY